MRLLAGLRPLVRECGHREINHIRECYDYQAGRSCRLRRRSGEEMQANGLCPHCEEQDRRIEERRRSPSLTRRWSPPRPRSPPPRAPRHRSPRPRSPRPKSPAYRSRWYESPGYESPGYGSPGYESFKNQSPKRGPPARGSSLRRSPSPILPTHISFPPESPSPPPPPQLLLQAPPPASRVGSGSRSRHSGRR